MNQEMNQENMNQGNTKQEVTQVINGTECIENSKGYWVPVSTLKPLDLMRDEFVREKFKVLLDLSAQIKAVKDSLFEDIAAFVSVSAAEYGVSIGGKKGNVTLSTFDGRYQIQRQMADVISFDERIQAAKALIDECLRDWTADAGPEIKAIVDQAFEVDKEGNISTARVLSLRRINITDARWVNAMQAIGDSLQCTGTKPYVRAKIRDESGNYQHVSLDIASV